MRAMVDNSAVIEGDVNLSHETRHSAVTMTRQNNVDGPNNTHTQQYRSGSNLYLLVPGGKPTRRLSSHDLAPSLGCPLYCWALLTEQGRPLR